MLADVKNTLMVQLNLHGSCSVCGKKFETGDTKVMEGKLMGVSGLLSGVAGMEPSSLKFYCSGCAKKVFSQSNN